MYLDLVSLSIIEMASARYSLLESINFEKCLKQYLAEYLELPDPELYTGYSFRRTSVSILANAKADVERLKRHGGWKDRPFSHLRD